MKVIQKTCQSDIATVYIAKSDSGKLVEFVESTQPPVPRSKKWVLIISTLFGCPIRCKFCDAGRKYEGLLSVEEMLFQIDYLIKIRFGDTKTVPVSKFKIQFARMGEPAFNPNVLSILECLPEEYDCPGLLPSLSTIAPEGCDDFFEELISIKERHYKNNFQLQFSLHSTDSDYRDYLTPVKKWSFTKIAAYGDRFYNEGNRKITLNFALTDESPLDPVELRKWFDPELFIVKITPVNPTFQAMKNHMHSLVNPRQNSYKIIDGLQKSGYDVILSIGEWEENRIGSNCGQYISQLNENINALDESYTYTLTKL